MTLPRRAVRVAAAAAVFCLLAAWYQSATALERRRMAATALAAQPSSARPDIDAGRLIADVAFLSSPEMEGRRTGSPGNHRAQAFILSRFKQLGLRPVAGGYEQKFSFVHRSIIGTVMPGRPATTAYPDATNLVGMVKGTAVPEEWLLVTAHYDHLGVRDGQVYPGADDNASGVAAMLQAAAWIAAHPLRHSVLFIAFDGEEQGLRGAAYFVAHPLIDLRRIRLMINLDMVARGDAGSIVASGAAFDPSLRDLVTQAAAGLPIAVAFGHDRPMYVAGGIEDWTQQSDHGPFHDAGVPTLYFGVEDHADYHRPTDTADKIPRPFFTAAAQLVLNTVRAADAR